jgi:hypothetical protein
MLLALVGNLYLVPEGNYGKLPYIYPAYLAARGRQLTPGAKANTVHLVVVTD